MFCVPRRRQKKHCPCDVEPGDKHDSSPRRSLNIEDQVRPVVPDPPAASATVSTPTETPKEKTKKVSRWPWWLHRKKKPKPSPVSKDVAQETIIPPSSATDESVNSIEEAKGGEADTRETPVSVALDLQLQTESNDVAEDTQTTSPTEESVNTQEETSSVQEEATPTSPDTPVSAAPDLQLQTNNTEVAEELPPSPTEESLNTDYETEGEVKVQEEASSTSPDTPVSAAPDLQLQIDSTDVAEELPPSPTEESLNTDNETQGGVKVQEEATPTSPDTPVSAAPDLQLQTVNTDVAEELLSSATDESVNTQEETRGDQEEATPTSPDTPVSVALELQLQTESNDVAEDTQTTSPTGESVNTQEETRGDQEEATPTSPDTPVSAAPDLQLQTVNTDVAQELPSSATDESVNTQEETSDVQEAALSTSPDTPVSVALDLQIDSTDVAEDRPSSPTEESVSTIKEPEGDEANVRREASPTPDTSVTLYTGKKKLKPWLCRLLLFWCQLESPTWIDETAGKKKGINFSRNNNSTDGQIDGKDAAETGPELRQPTPTGHGGSGQVQTLSKEELVCLGFPNLAQTCYLNATLQGLLTLTPFVQEVYNQEKLWTSHPASRVMRGFAEVDACRFSKNQAGKRRVLAAFKRTVAEFNSVFEDSRQKDAHEFLSCVLNMLQMETVNMGVRYTCPVNAHITFQLWSMRTCKGCRAQSVREEDYTNLSLDLVPGGSVQHFLEAYLKEGQVDYQCQCGAGDSKQQSSFLTLPNVLILQLKRFRFTRNFRLQKENSSVDLSRELVVAPESCYTEQTPIRYSLVSIVSHLGSTADSGHYICDAAHKETPDEVTDRWLTFDDSHVSETTGTSICRQRRKNAYLLFYEKHQR